MAWLTPDISSIAHDENAAPVSKDWWGLPNHLPDPEIATMCGFELTPERPRRFKNSM